VRSGFACEECGEAKWLSQGSTHLTWLRDREHVVREVAEHTSSGLETWMADGLAFLDDHRGHPVVVISEKA
jgi:hypothetical protein